MKHIISIWMAHQSPHRLEHISSIQMEIHSLGLSQWSFQQHQPSIWMLCCPKYLIIYNMFFRFWFNVKFKRMPQDSKLCSVWRKLAKLKHITKNISKTSTQLILTCLKKRNKYQVTHEDALYCLNANKI